jgi:putative CocE/NonD family hydrolase
MMEKPTRSFQRSQERSQWQALFQQNTGDPVQMLVTIFDKELPAPSTEFGQEDRIRVSMRDGIGLATRVFLPAGQGPWPVILTRYPYPMAALMKALGRVWTRHGYAFVAQECRGTNASEGVWVPWEHERDDGLDTVDWLKRQVWSNGNIGMWGRSYLSGVQWVMADQLPPEVKALVLSVNGTERYRQLYMNGMFRQDAFTSWAFANSEVKTRQDPGELYQQALYARPHLDVDVKLLGQELPWYREWISNVSREGEYWKRSVWNVLQHIPPQVHTPVLMVGGWYDHNLDGMIRAYEQFPEQTKAASRFVIGPWIHALESSGDLDYPDSDVLGTFTIKQATEWFDHQLKGQSYPYRKGGIDAYIIREGRWQVWDRGFPQTQKQAYYLRPGQEVYPSSGQLTSEASSTQERISYTYNPDNPVPTQGGEGLLAFSFGPTYHGAAPSSLKQAEPGSRADVITFLSAPLQMDVAIQGRIKAHLRVSSDVDDTAFTVKLMEVFPNGNAYNIRDGISSLAYRNGATQPQDYVAGEAVDIEIELWPIAWTIKQGSQIRLDISSSNFPAYHVHPNVSGPWAEQQQVRIAQQTLFIGGAQSYVEFPVADASLHADGIFTAEGA